MAIRVRSNRKSKYLVYWRNPHTGRQESMAFDTLLEARKKDAEVKYRLEYEPQSFKKEKRTVKKEDTEKTAYCLEDVAIMYLQEKQFEKRALGRQLTFLRPALSLIGRKRLDVLQTSDLSAVLSFFISRDVKNTTICTYMKRLFTILNWARKRGFVKTLPIYPELPVAHYEHFVPPSPSEIAALYKAAPSNIKRIIVLGVHFGMRVGPCEMFRLRWEHFDFEKQVCRVPSSKKNLSEQWREVPIKSSILTLIESWWKEDAEKQFEYVIHNKQGSPISQIAVCWHKTCAAAGISRRIRPYDLRHAFATMLIAGGADIGTVARLMGHTNVTMVLHHYQHVLTQQKKAAIDSLPELPLYDHNLYDHQENIALQ